MHESASIETGDLIEPLRRMGLLKAGEAVRLTPLTGGVSSDISLVEAGGRRFCVKRALPRLKVAALWEAPVGRNAAEAAYMRAVARWLPHAVPRVLGEDAEAGWFAMDYLAPEDHPLWKARASGRDRGRGFRRGGRARSRHHPCAQRRRPEHSGRVCERRDVRGDPHRALSACDWPRASCACGAPRCARAYDADDEARAGSWRHQSEEHPSSSDRAGVPRRRMRLVRRSRLRSCLLSQSSPAQGRARRRRQDALHRRFLGASERRISLASIGRARPRSKRALPPCCRPCSSPGSTASRRSSTSPARASARPCAAARSPDRQSAAVSK